MTAFLAAKAVQATANAIVDDNGALKSNANRLLLRLPNRRQMVSSSSSKTKLFLDGRVARPLNFKVQAAILSFQMGFFVVNFTKSA